MGCCKSVHYDLKGCCSNNMLFLMLVFGHGFSICSSWRKIKKLKDWITPHVTNFFRLRLTIEEQEGKRKYKSDGAVMVGEFVCMYVCSCTVSE